MRTRPPLLLPLFRSDAQARLLAELVLHPDRELSVTDLAERADVPYSTAHRELAQLIAAALLEERRVGNARMVRASKASPYFAGLQQMLEAAFGPVTLLRTLLQGIRGVQSAAVFGSYAERLAGIDGPAPNDVDVLIVGDPDTDEIYDACAEVSRIVDRPVNPTILTDKEWASGDVFVRQVRDGVLTPIIGPDVPAVGELVGGHR